MNKRRDILKSSEGSKVYNPAGDSVKEIQEMNRLSGDDGIDMRATTTKLCSAWYSLICC